MAGASAKCPTFSSATLPPNKRARLFAPRPDEERTPTAAKVDPTYGQRGAFPGLEEDDEGAEELFYGPADDGLAYLKMVRLEAKGVPNLLVAPAAAKSKEKEDPYAPYEPRREGWYSDGAYIAASTSADVNEQYEGSEKDPQEEYYAALLVRYGELRSTLSASPPSSASQIDPAVRSLLSHSKPRHWKHALLKSQPTPVLLCSLPPENAIVGIEVLESLLTAKNLRGGVRHRLGAWAWGLLGRCRRVNEMDSEDVSVLRGLGKKSCALLRRLRAGEKLDGIDEEDREKRESDFDQDRNSDIEAGMDDVNDDGNVDVFEDGNRNNNGDEDENTGPQSATADIDAQLANDSGDNDTGILQDIEVSLEEARKQLLSGLFADDGAIFEGSDRSTSRRGVADDGQRQVSDAHALLDVIVTVVGECYGQRDLLDGRLAWEEI